MLIKNYRNTIVNVRLHQIILRIFNEKTLPLLGVKRPTRLNKSNALAIMSFIAKNESLEDAIKYVKENSVKEGKPVGFTDLLGGFSLNGQRYYHGINVSEIYHKLGYPALFSSYSKDEELELFLDCYEEPETPQDLPEEFPKAEPLPLPEGGVDEFEEKDETPQPKDEQEAPKQENPLVLQKAVQSEVAKAFESVRIILNDDAKTQMRNALEDSIDEITRRVAKMNGKEKILVVNGEEKKLPYELYHKQFKQLLNLVANGFNIYLYGEAGDGKTRLVSQVAQSLGMNFYTQTPSDVIGLLGYNDIRGEFQDTPFTEWVKKGGLLYLSEFDNVGDAILSINTALANGFITINKKRLELHKDCRFVADGNTKGNGASAIYCGRNAIDGATLDRFIFVELEHDNDLELALSGGNKEWMAFIKMFRKIRDTKKIRCLATMRATINVCKLESMDYPLTSIIKDCLLKGLSGEPVKTIADEIMIKLPENKYAKALSEVAR